MFSIQTAAHRLRRAYTSTLGQMHIVSYKLVQTQKHDARSHTITQVGDYLHKYREDRVPEIDEM